MTANATEQTAARLIIDPPPGLVVSQGYLTNAVSRFEAMGSAMEAPLPEPFAALGFATTSQ
jgi:hypothetical protein